MTTYLDIDIRIKNVAGKVSDLAFMNKDQIFDMLAEIVAISDDISTFIRDIDVQMMDIETGIVEEYKDKKVSAAMLDQLAKPKILPLKTDKKWAERQNSLLSEIRMAALAAARTLE